MPGGEGRGEGVMRDYVQQSVNDLRASAKNLRREARMKEWAANMIEWQMVDVSPVDPIVDRIREVLKLRCKTALPPCRIARWLDVTVDDVKAVVGNAVNGFVVNASGWVLRSNNA